MSADTIQEPEAFRQNLVDEAANFLVNPKVINHANDKKSAFLRKKGLSEAEIQAAFAKSTTSVSKGVIQNSEIPHPGPYSGPLVPAYAGSAPPSLWLRIRDVCNFVFFLMGASYGLYHIYQRYLGPWLMGRRQKTVEESITELQQSVVTVLKEVQTTLASLEQTLSAQNIRIQALKNKDVSQDNVSPKQLEQLKAEITSLKGLLINRRTFPSTPSMAPSIPSWQRNKTVEKPVETSSDVTLNVSNQVEVIEADIPLSSKDKEVDLSHVPLVTDAVCVGAGVLKGDCVAHIAEENGNGKDEESGCDSGSILDLPYQSYLSAPGSPSVGLP
ncbi:peroxisomal membrane protein PEX14-like isoform X2 [Panulirus ornatus]|uniref:peroxisomal membrane protein PEX14-like isoform X2 n=1 Tax=Panulirus ornatus TaxID=150431 RepID=UPI003A8C87D5